MASVVIDESSQVHTRSVLEIRDPHGEHTYSHVNWHSHMADYLPPSLPQWVTCVGLGSAAASDILIAVAMCYYLYTKRTGLRRHVFNVNSLYAVRENH